jgi:hypothetical protein
MPAEDVSQKKGPSIKIKFTLHVQSKQSSGTIQQLEAPLNDGHSELLGLVREQLHHSGM